MATAIALAAPVALQAQGPASSLRPSEPTAIVAAARSCHDAVTPERLDEARLAADGWAGGEIRTNGAQVDTPLRIFSRDSVLLFAVQGNPGCVVMARLRSLRGYPRVIDGLTAIFGRPAGPQTNRYTWALADGRGLMVDATGSRRQPGVRIAVVHTGGNASGTPK